MLLINVFSRFYRTTWNGALMCHKQPGLLWVSLWLGICPPVWAKTVTRLRLLLPYPTTSVGGAFNSCQPTKVACHIEGWIECCQAALAGRVCLRRLASCSACHQKGNIFGSNCMICLINCCVLYCCGLINRPCGALMLYVNTFNCFVMKELTMGNVVYVFDR